MYIYVLCMYVCRESEMKCALPVITTMALWQLYAHLASVRFEHSLCRGSLMTTYI